MDSRFKRGIDPIRNPLVQKKIETTFKENYDKVLKVIQIQVVKLMKNKQE